MLPCRRKLNPINPKTKTLKAPLQAEILAALCNELHRCSPAVKRFTAHILNPT